MHFRFLLLFYCLICASAHAGPVDDKSAPDPTRPPTINLAEKCGEAIVAM